MADIERKRITGTACINGIDYDFDAVVFRVARYGAFGRIGAPPWQFGRYSTLRTAPAIAIESRAELEAEIARRANGPDEASATEQP